MKTFPTINRRVWIALEMQARRRKRLRFANTVLLPAPVVRAAYPDLLQWDWDLPNPFRWNVWMSLDNGASWTLVDDYWTYGDARQFAPDGGSELYYLVGVDESGNEITEHSNIVRPDDAPITLLAGLVGYWKLDEPDGQVRLDATAAAQHLSDTNADFPSGPGRLGNAAASAEEYLNYQLAADLVAPLSGPARSVSWWANPASGEGTNFQIFLCLDGGDTTNYAVQCFTIGSYDFCVQFFGPYLSLLGWITYDAWNHFVATTDGITTWLYVNGTVFAMDTAEESSPTRLWIGNYYDMDRSILGSMDEVGIWNRCLSAEEVASLYNFGNGLPLENF